MKNLVRHAYVKDNRDTKEVFCFVGIQVQRNVVLL